MFITILKKVYECIIKYEKTYFTKYCAEETCYHSHQ